MSRISGRRPLTLFVLILFLTAMIPVLVPSGRAAVDPASKLTGELPEVLAGAAPDELIPVSIVLEDQLTGPRLRERAARAIDATERRRLLATALKAHARGTQQGLLALLDRARLAGRAERIRPLWIGNIVAVELTADDILEIAARSDVARINWAPQRPVFLERSGDAFGRPSGLPEPPLRANEIECGVDLMQAPRVWNELANFGDGAVIAVIDSGVCWSHPDIANQIWVNPGEDLDADGVVMDADDLNGVDDDGNGYVDDLIGYDIENVDHDPDDNNSHGSHVAGTVAGDGTSGTEAGMAPDARIMVLRVGLSTSDEPDVWEAMQYAADNGADSISMSLGWRHVWGPDRPTWRTNCDNVIDLGTAMVIAAGNEGSGDEPDNVRTPGDVPRIISVGATDCSDNVASFSSRGPVTWQNEAPWNDHPYPPGLVKPDVSAPGVSTKSHNLCSGYSNKSGTSMATPHVAGAVALMKAANPGLTHDDLKLLLEDTAIDLGEVGKDNVYGSGRVDAYEAVRRSQSSDGTMSVRELAVSCASLLNLTVADFDLRGAGSVTVEVTSDTETTAEIVTLLETSATSGVFVGDIDTDDGPQSPDGRIQVSHGDTITATYLDADDGLGGTGVAKVDTALTDCLEPVIADVVTTDVTVSSAIVRWDTDESSTSNVTYGEQKPPTVPASSGGLVTSHAVTLSGLQECTVYFFEVDSADRHGNAAGDDNGGLYYHFETLGDFGSGPQPCHAGQVAVGAATFACGDSATFEVTDLDLNLDSAVADTAVLEITSTTETTAETITVTETGPNTSTFTGSIALMQGSPAADGVLQVTGGDVVTATYRDLDDGTGTPAISFDTALMDCAGPVIRDLRVTDVTDQRLTVQFDTDEPGDTLIEWGTTPALGQIISQTGLSTAHAGLVNRLQICEPMYLRVSSTDAFGNTSVADLGGTPFAAHTWDVPGLYARDTFEAGAPGWTLEGEWEIGPPQGLGGSSGPADPLFAYNNQGVLGHDLSGLGANAGDYEPLALEIARSPDHDGSSWTGTRLIYHRRLAVHQDDDASLWLFTNGVGRPLFRSAGTTTTDSSYQTVALDIGVFADGASSVYLEFRQQSDAQLQYSGWNVDDVILKDGALPDYAPCATCGASPSFGGALAAVDDDACGGSGVTISWDPAVSWGTGNAGSYAVYRDTTPGFTPSGASLVAAGIAGLAYTDTTAPQDQTLHYVVRAENDESCGSGPANGGLIDDNLVYASVGETTSQPFPVEVTGITAELVNFAHVRLDWPAVTGAATYRVYRSESPQAGSFTLLAETSSTFYEDLDQGASGVSYHYLVTAVNACGQEGP